MNTPGSGYDVDVLIHGGGIAGLWTLNHLRALGYDCLLVEPNALGGGQTIASQGIIHSGLKYAFAGQINALAASISAMPDLWRAALRGDGPVDLRAAKTNANSQYLLVPGGLMGGLISLVTQRALGGNVRSLPKSEWPDTLVEAEFEGSVIFMDEPVLDIQSVIRALSLPHQSCIRSSAEGVRARRTLYTAGAANAFFARQNAHEEGLKTQARPLLMGLMKHAPFDLFAHLVGPSDKPVATITTHHTTGGERVWYLGGGVAERPLNAPAHEVYDSALKGFAKYLPALDLDRVQWAVLPIDRIEGKSETDGWMPDTPTLHSRGDCLYAWPTKLTFAPLLARRVEEQLRESGIAPAGRATNFSALLPPCSYAVPPWETVSWTRLNTTNAA